jgi:hypothetical protein
VINCSISGCWFGEMQEGFVTRVACQTLSVSSLSLDDHEETPNCEIVASEPQCNSFLQIFLHNLEFYSITSFKNNCLLTKYWTWQHNSAYVMLIHVLLEAQMREGGMGLEATFIHVALKILVNHL